MLKLDNICKTFNPGTINEKKALQNLSLTLKPGDFVTVIGGNGAGKSTILRCINRMHDISKGELTVDGVDVDSLRGKDLRRYRRKVGMIFQSFNLVSRSTAIKNVLTADVPDMNFFRVLFGVFTKEQKMRALESLLHGGERVADLGSGSGILSITAILLGAAHATGVDIDPKAEDIARENAAINGLHDDRFRAVTGDVIGDKAMMERLGSGYDIVLANIVADVIIPLAPHVPQFLKPGGIFICSGILEQRLPEVVEILKEGSAVAEQTAAATLADVRKSMRIDYFTDNNLLK